MSNRVRFIKIRYRTLLGIKKGAAIVAKYYSREDANACKLPGSIYSAPVAYTILKEYNSSKNEN